MKSQLWQGLIKLCCVFVLRRYIHWPRLSCLDSPFGGCREPLTLCIARIHYFPFIYTTNDPNTATQLLENNICKNFHYSQAIAKTFLTHAGFPVTPTATKFPTFFQFSLFYYSRFCAVPSICFLPCRHQVGITLPVPSHSDWVMGTGYVWLLSHGDTVLTHTCEEGHTKHACSVKYQRKKHSLWRMTDFRLVLGLLCSSH